jgi:rubrerythrin
MIEDLAWSALLLVGIAVLGLLLGGGAKREDIRARRRWDAAFDYESRRLSRTDATGMLRCRSCGANASERAGRCPSCGATL